MQVVELGSWKLFASVGRKVTVAVKEFGSIDVVVELKAGFVSRTIVEIAVASDTEEPEGWTLAA